RYPAHRCQTPARPAGPGPRRTTPTVPIGPTAAYCGLRMPNEGRRGSGPYRVAVAPSRGRPERMKGATLCRATVGSAPRAAASAPLTAAPAKAPASLARAPLSARQLAGRACRAEHDHVGVRCGIMDQTIAALAQPRHGLLIECGSAEARQIPFRGRLLLVDTGGRHELAAGALNRRRGECEAAVARLQLELPELTWLAAWPAAWLARLKRALPEPLRARAVHVVGETARTRFGAQLLARGRLKQF